MEEDFRALLLNTTAVTDVVSTRIDFAGGAQGTPDPRIVLWVIGDNEEHRMCGPDGLSDGRVQVDCYCGEYGQAKLLSRAVRAALDGHSDANFQGIFHAGTRDSREGGTNEAYRSYRVSLDFITNHQQA